MREYILLAAGADEEEEGDGEEGEDRKYICQECGESFPQRAQIMVHMQLHLAKNNTTTGGGGAAMEVDGADVTGHTQQQQHPQQLLTGADGTNLYVDFRSNVIVERSELDANGQIVLGGSGGGEGQMMVDDADQEQQQEAMMQHMDVTGMPGASTTSADASLTLNGAEMAAVPTSPGGHRGQRRYQYW